MNRVSGRRGAFVLVAGLLAVAGCSSDDDAASTSSDVSETTATPEVTEPTAATAVPDDSAPEPDVTTDVTTAPDGDFDPYAQTLEWVECELGECATATVPIDYDDPSAGTTTIAMSRSAATGDRQGSLFVNPGGPGGSGVDFTFSLIALGSPELSEAYDLIGFDPRGVGTSDPLGCLDTAGLDELLATDVDPDNQASVDAFGELVGAQGDACLATNPQLAQHVTTVETAKDLDVMRSLVGDEQLNYYGASYGTFLGATYAALFPEQVGRLVLDGAVDPSLSAIQQTLRQAGGFQLAFDDYLADCLANDCPLGSSADEVEAKVTELFATAAATPLPTDNPERPLTQTLAVYGIVAPLYAPDVWPVLTESLTAAFDGDGTLLLAAADQYTGRGPDEYFSNQAQAQTAITCLDAQIAGEPDSAPTEDDFLAASPLFGAQFYGLSEVGCDTWPIEPTVEAPDYSAAGAAPILVVGATGDPATPIEEAETLADVLDSGVLLIRDGDGHTSYFAMNSCITSAVDSFLLDGTVPEDGTECPNETTTPDSGIPDDADTTEEG